MTQSEKRVFDKDTFDAIELSALVHGGIGQPDVFEGHRYFGTGEDDKSVPVCLLGHWSFVRDDKYAHVWPSVVGHESDRAVARINIRKGRPTTSRVSWKEYTRELNIVRGE